MGKGSKSSADANGDSERLRSPASDFPLLETNKQQPTIQSTGDGHLSNVKHPTTYIETLINLVKGNTGAGMFAMGDAFKNSGLLLGPLLTIFLGTICVYGNHILINACKVIRSRKQLNHLPSFAETVQLCFEEGPKSIRSWSHAARTFTFIFITLTQLGFCSVYFVFISSTAKKVLDPHGFSVNVHVFMAIILVPILLTSLVRTLKFLTPFSFIANVCLMSGVCLTLYLSARDLPSPSTRRLAADPIRLPLFFGTTVYAFEGISLVLPLQNEMRNPKKFNSTFGVLNMGMTLVCAIMCSIGFIGYLKFGEDVKGSLALNLPQNEIFSEIVQVVISVGILLSYTLQFYVPVKILWPLITERYGPFKRPVLYEELFRTAIVLVTFITAESVPNLGLFISLVGAVCGTTLALIFPPICDLVLRWPTDFGGLWWRLILDIFCLVVAVIGLTTGCYYSVEAIILEYV